MQVYLLVLIVIGSVIGTTCLYSQGNDSRKKVQLAYSVWEPSEKDEKHLPPIIFLHGLTADRNIWEPFAPRIVEATGRKAYALDARDHGDSPWTDDASFDIMADDLNDFMDSQNIPKALLVGHSMGGRVAQTFALKHPEKVEKFVSEDMSTASIKPEDLNVVMLFFTVLREAIKMVPSGLDERQAKTFLAQFLRNINQPDSTSEITDYELLNIVIKKENGRYVWKANLAGIEKTFKKGQLGQDLHGEFSGEALFLYGGKSQARVDSDEKNIKRLFPKARLVKVEDAGHEIHTMFPDLFIKEVTEFVNK